VDSIGVKTDAETATWKDEDVSQVVNQIVVGTIAVDPNQIVNDARRRILNHYANSIFDNIEVDSQGSTLIVHGQVTQPYKKEAVGYFLTHVRGVVAIENKIQILPLSVDDDDLRMRLARAIYDDPSFAKYAETAHPPIHIIVDGENVTLAGTVDSDLDKSRAGQDAQLVLKYLSLHNNLRVVGQETRQ
jgi:hyperosmotically inducible periplasmic protein